MWAVLAWAIPAAILTLAFSGLALGLFDRKEEL